MGPFVFIFAPIPLTSEQSPLLHAAILTRRNQAQIPVVAKPRYRIEPAAGQNRSTIAKDAVQSTKPKFEASETELV
jgi:hypothetical protein